MSAGLELASVHMPKAAGTSFRVVLERWYGDTLAESYEAGAIPETARAVHGHFRAATVAADHHITWMREPAARVASHYYFWRSLPEMHVTDDLQRQMREENLSLLEFAEMDGIPDLMTSYMSGWSVDDFLFVGIAESSGPEVGRLARLLGKPSMTLSRANPTISAEYNAFLTSPDWAATTARLRELNPADCDLYAQALDRMQGFWKSFAA